MLFKCCECDKQYRINEKGVSAKLFQVRCTSCGEAFVVNKHTGASFSAKEYKRKKALSKSKSSPSDPAKETAKAPFVRKKSHCQVITVCNQKGGVAKTSSCLNIATSLVLLKKRVLLIDFDVQANLSFMLGFTQMKSFFDVVNSSDIKLVDCIVQAQDNLWLLPSNDQMALLVKNHFSDKRFEYLLSEELELIKDKFDFIFIDTPPSGDFYALNALMASNKAIITTQCEMFSLQGVSHIESLIKLIKQDANHDIDFQLLITLFKADNTAAQAVLKKIMSTYKGHILTPVISYDEKIQQSQIVQKPVIMYDRSSLAGRQYYQVAKKLLDTTHSQSGII